MPLLLVPILRAVSKIQKAKKSLKEILHILKLAIVQLAKTSAKNLQLSEKI